MDQGPLRRIVTRLTDTVNAVRTARQLWVTLPTALGVSALMWSVAREWFQRQVLLVQFLAATSVFLFLVVVLTVLAQIVWRAWRILNVEVSAGHVDSHAGGSQYHAAFVGLKDLLITTRERRVVSVELRCVWRCGPGRERPSKLWVASDGSDRNHWVLNEQTPTLRERDVRFFLPYSDEVYDHPDNADLRQAESLVYHKALVFLVIRDRISGKERRIRLQTGVRLGDS